MFDATTMMIEAWVNDGADERKGIFLFLDMEKAFDRVSFKFLLTSMALDQN